MKIARLEEGQESLQKQIDKGQESLQKQIDVLRSEIKSVESEMKGFMLWGFGITFAGMFALIGFVLWDRRTALAPAVREIEVVKERDEKIVRILQEYALKEPGLAAVMKSVAL